MKKKLFTETNVKENAVNDNIEENYAVTTIESYVVCRDSNTYCSNLELDNSIVIIESKECVTSDEDKIKRSQEKEITRKRKRNPENWQRNILKKKREAGEEYCNIKGKQCRAKKVQTGCVVNCAYKCLTRFTCQEREDIKTAFYSLNDAQKNKFYKEFTLRVPKDRTRTSAEESRRKYSFQYIFFKNEQKERICQKFFCGTLDIAPKRIYYFYNKLQKHPLKIVPTPAKGKYIKKQTPENKIDEVVLHIKSFPTQESHFCRANTKRQYLDQSLSITKMYSLYVESTREPVKENIYRKFLNERFNLAFHRPKKDACDACWEFRAQKTPNAEQTLKYEEHLKRKQEGNIEREKDRQLNDTTAVITFDLENIFSLPKANVSCFFSQAS